MAQDKNNKDLKDTNVHIEQVNPQVELQDLEKQALNQLEKENKKEDLSRTQKFRLVNSKKKKFQNIELPIKKQSLYDTIKIKLSDLRKEIDKNNLDLPKEKQTKSLYDTVIIKLDDLINSKNALKRYNTKKITNIEDANVKVPKWSLFKAKDITKKSDFKLNVDSEEFGKQLYNLNKYALTKLSNERPKKVRKYTTLSKLNKIEKVHVSKKNYLKYQKQLNNFAINKLYYKFAPKETKKYKVYKYSVMLSSLIFIVTSLVIVNWFIQGIQVKDLSNALTEDAEIVEVEDTGEIYVTEDLPEPETNDEYSNKSSLYWKYLNTPLSSVDFTELKNQNKDTVGWIIVKNTNVNYPVVQTTNNDYYLNHSFTKTKNSAGWVFADYRDDFSDFNQNTIIYAHGRKDKVMFGSLTNTLSAKWYKDTDNQLIQFSTPKYNTMWQIFSIYKIKAESYYITSTFASDGNFDKWLKEMKKRSIYDFGIDVSTEDKILTLSTCYNDNGIRLVVQAKLVKIQER